MRKTSEVHPTNPAGASINLCVARTVVDCAWGLKRVKSLFCAQQQSPAVPGAGPAPGSSVSPACQELCIVAVWGRVWGAFPALPPAAL